MNEKIAKRVEEIALDLASTLSVVETTGEIDIAEKVYDIFSKMGYYQKNPQHLYYVDAKDDSLKRKSVVAILEGKKAKSDKTILMIGHIDSVGISDYGNLKEYANQPLKLTEKFKEIDLPPAVKADLDSGDYWFGRGLFDMKSGDATIMTIMEMISEDIENFEGNLIFAAVCDEEGNSAGMLSCVHEFVKLKEEKGYDYLALLDADYITEEYEG
ncbi:MAG: M20/M25/M40 family metallo-hydrolase, partial [Candidatus Moranbacteria bacterium]|nr:M20/M25/M40 family metallo-hydrolase [Candidatus Moranbacteria bacterium]